MRQPMSRVTLAAPFGRAWPSNGSITTGQDRCVWHLPDRPTLVRKEDGGLAQGPVEILDRWQQHFSKPLNQQSEYREDVIEQMSE